MVEIDSSFDRHSLMGPLFDTAVHASGSIVVIVLGGRAVAAYRGPFRPVARCANEFEKCTANRQLDPLRFFMHSHWSGTDNVGTQAATLIRIAAAICLRLAQMNIGANKLSARWRSRLRACALPTVSTPSCRRSEGPRSAELSGHEFAVTVVETEAISVRM